jgi:uncharacterized cupin superfamily protein
MSDWYIANARDMQWFDGRQFGFYSDFQKGGHFEEFGFNIAMVLPGQPGALYHRESHEEGFLVLSGQAVLIVDGEERPLRAWDYFHCPAGVEHVIVGAGDGPCVLIGVGGRVGPGNPVYTVNDVALKHGAGVEEETATSSDAYAPFPGPVAVPFREEFLP